MHKSTRVTAVVGATMALVIAGTAAVAAAGPRDRDEMHGFGGPQMGGMGGFGFDLQDGMGGGFRGLDGGFRGLDSDVERTERTVQTADGTTTVRVEQGVVDSAAADSLSFSLGSGEAITVVVDEDTQAIAFEESEVTSSRGWTRTRLAPTEIAAADITAGSEIVVWSESEDGADFVASRIAVQPVVVADEDTAATEDDGAAVEDTGAAVDSTEDAATTDA